MKHIHRTRHLAFFALMITFLLGATSFNRRFARAGGGSARPSATTVKSGQRLKPTPCTTCSNPSLRRIYAPAIELPEAEKCELVLNSRSPHPIDVTPTLYSANGDAVTGNTVQLQPAEIRFVPVEGLIPAALRGRHHWGAIALSYTGGVLEVWAQITFHGVGESGSIDETFNILEEPGSDTREAVWWMPKRSTAIVALGNSSDVAIQTTAQFSDGEAEEVDIAPFATKFLRRRARERDDARSNIESVKLTTSGPAGSLRVAGFLTSEDRTFTSSIRFYDTKKTVQPILYATNLRLGNTIPRMVLKNTSEVEVSARPRFFSESGEQGNPVDLPTVTLRPQQTTDVELRTLTEAAASRTDFDSVSVQVLNSGAPGSLIGALYSTDRSTQLTYDVPLRDSGKMRNSTGSYPWRVDDDYTTIVNVTNITDQSASFIVDIRYPGGHYFLPVKELAVGGTATFDLRKLISEQKPDGKGNVIPLSTTGGQFHWSVFAGAASSKFIGRSEVVSLSQRVSSSYSCPSCCPDSGPFGYIVSPESVPVGGFAGAGTEGQTIDCNGFVTDVGGLYISPWWIENSSIASVTSQGEVHGLSVGETSVDGSWTCYIWSPGPDDCYRETDQASDSQPMDVVAHDLYFTQVRYLNLSASFTSVVTDEATLNLGGATDSDRICTNPTASGSDFSITINFRFPLGGTLRERSDPHNVVVTGANNQFEWLSWDFVTVDSAGGTGSMYIKLFRRSRTNPKSYVDFAVTGHNPSGTVGDFAGRGRVNLVCP